MSESTKENEVVIKNELNACVLSVKVEIDTNGLFLDVCYNDMIIHDVHVVIVHDEYEITLPYSIHSPFSNPSKAISFYRNDQWREIRKMIIELVDSTPWKNLLIEGP